MHWTRKWQPTPVFLPEESQGLGSLVGCRLWGHKESDTTEVTEQQQQVGVVKNLPASAGEACWISGLGRSPGGGISNPMQYPCLENPMDRD